MLLLLAASARLYDALLGLYPRAFRRRYGAEMRRDFRELSREGLEEGGVTELARVLAEALPDLALTALEERSTVLAKNSRSLSVDPRMVVGVMVAAVLVAMGVTATSLWQTPTYEASALVMVGERYPAQGMGNGKIHPIPPLALPPERVEEMSRAAAGAIDTRPVAEETIRRLELETSPNS